MVSSLPDRASTGNFVWLMFLRIAAQPNESSASQRRNRCRRIGRHWDSRDPSCCTPYKEVGVADMPKTKAAWKEIGEMVRANVAAGATLK